MFCFVFIKSQSESLKAFQWVPRFVLRYARYNMFIASISIWFYISYLRNSLLPFDSFSYEGNYISTLLKHIFLLHTDGIQNLEKIFPLKCSFKTTLFAIPRLSKEKKNSTLNFFEFL